MKNPIWSPAQNAVDIVTLAALEREFSVTLTPEDAAMLAALFSRDPSHPREHVRRIAAELTAPDAAIGMAAQVTAERKSARFMERFYSGYAHKSIADCGSTTIFFIGLSVLAAKAFQDSPLFSGQELSTRYNTLNSAPIWEPTGGPKAHALIGALMDFYQRAEGPVLEHVKAMFPRRESEKEKDWEGAVKARGFDIRRGFLPAGIATNVAWHGNLRQLADHLLLLRHHPLEEVRNHAITAWTKLRHEYPSSFPENAAMLDVSGERALGRVGAVENYRKLIAKWMWNDLAPEKGQFPDTFTVGKDTIEWGELSDLAHSLLEGRPRGAGLPAGFGQLGLVTFEAPVDFGSYRDLHRQRRGFWQMPLLTPFLGFEPWYIDQLPEALREEARVLVAQATEVWNEIAANGRADAQYMLPMGFRVAWRYTCGLPQVLYFGELRASKTVHPTARYVGQEIARYVHSRWDWVAVHADLDKDDWDVRRGAQTITKKD